MNYWSWLKINPKPFDNCGGCKLYENKCHCLCHNEIDCPGYHEIIYQSGEIERSNFIIRIYNTLTKNNKIWFYPLRTGLGNQSRIWKIKNCCPCILSDILMNTWCQLWLKWPKPKNFPMSSLYFLARWSVPLNYVHRIIIPL